MGAWGMQSFPALTGGLVVRGQSGGDVRGRAHKINSDFTLEVNAGQLIEIFFRDLQAVTDENQRRGEIGGSMGRTRIDEGIVGKRESLRWAVGYAGRRGFGLVGFVLIRM